MTLGGPDHDQALRRAMALISLFSEDVNRILAEHLGGGSTGNRTIQVLLAVEAEPGTTPSQVAARVGMTRSATARSLAHLLADGLVAKVPDSLDRRSARLFPTGRASLRVAGFEQAFGAYLVDSAPVAREIVALLRPSLGGTGPSDGRGLLADSADPIARVSVRQVLQTMTRTGAPFMAGVMAFASKYRLEGDSDRAVLTMVLAFHHVRPSQVQRALQLSSGGATQLLDRLERAGLVRRSRPGSGDDGRSVLVSCTPRGTEAGSAIIDVLREQAGPMARAFAEVVSYAQGPPGAASTPGPSAGTPGRPIDVG